MIQLSHLNKSFDGGRSWIIKDISFTIEKGETLILLGSSGSGKTTVLKMINGLITPTSGNVEIEDKSIASYDPVELRRMMGYVFQDVGLFPHMTVAENIAIVLRLARKPLSKRRQRAQDLLDLVGLAPDVFANRYPAELSGGQQQRVGVARALAADPEYLLMDEPFGALDAIVRTDLQLEILRIKKELNKTILFVTHDIFEALRLGDRLAVLHQGKLEQIGKKEQLINAPKTMFVRDLFQNTAHQIQEFAGNFT